MNNQYILIIYIFTIALSYLNPNMSLDTVKIETHDLHSCGIRCKQ